MTIPQLRAAHKAVPFQPFTLQMADGRAFSVPLRTSFPCRRPVGLSSSLKRTRISASSDSSG